MRSLGRAPLFTILVIGCLTVGLGLTVAVFTIFYGVLLRPLPFTDPDRLVVLFLNGPEVTQVGPSWADLLDWRQRSQAFEDLELYVGTERMLRGLDQAEPLSGTVATPGLFPLLGVRPVLGRLYDASDDHPGAPGTILLSHHYWSARLGGDPTVLGRTLVLDEETFTVIGIMPPGFRLDPPVVLVGSGLMLKSLANLRAVAPGFDLGDLQPPHGELPVAGEDLLRTGRGGGGTRDPLGGCRGSSGRLSRPHAHPAEGRTVLRRPGCPRRLALGARPAGLVGLSLRRVVVPVGFGLALGLGLAFAMMRGLVRLLFGVTWGDRSVYLAAGVVLSTVALLAGYLPARRAARVDPVRALRTE